MQQHQQLSRKFVMVPQEEYKKLYNKHYVELTSLKKTQLDPDDQHGDFFKTSLKTHYPKVNAEMVKNDYIVTHRDRTFGQTTTKQPRSL